MRVLICLDDSPGAQAVLDTLNSRIWPQGSDIVLATVVPAAETGFIGKPLSESYRQEKHAAESAERMLLAHAHFYGTRLPRLGISIRVLAGTKPQEALLRFAENLNPDLMIAGCRGRRDNDPLHLGSVSQAILEDAPCPVLIARKNTHAGTINSDRMNILIPVDHSPFSAAAVDWYSKQLWCKAPRLRLLSVVPRLTGQCSQDDSSARVERILTSHHQMEDSSMHLLQKHAERLKAGSGTVTFEVQSGEPRDAILTSAESWGADLIIMGSHGLTGLQRFLLGSVSRTVSVNAKCSVEVIRKAHALPGEHIPRLAAQEP